MKYKLSITLGWLACLLCPLQLAAQNTSLSQCYEWGRANHPQLQNLELLTAISEMNAAITSTAHLPKMDLSGSASYQSDVPRMVLPNSNLPFEFPEIAKDWYKIYIDVQQSIYDGGRVKYKNKLQSAQLKTKLQQTEVSLYQVKQLINASFFSASYFKNSKLILETKKTSLEEQKKRVGSAVKNGVMLQNELDNLLAEIIVSEQDIMKIETKLQNSLTTLGVLCGKEFTEQQNFILPNIAIDTFQTDISNRPEIQLFSSRHNELEATKALQASSRLPKVFGFAQVGYGRPGLNLLDDSFTDWYLIGVGLKWNIWDWKKSNRSKQILTLNQQLIETGQANFERSQTIKILNDLNQISQFESLMKSDLELYELRNAVAQRSASQLQNGVITSADYILDINKASSAKLAMEARKIELVWAKMNFLFDAGADFENK